MFREVKSARGRLLYKKSETLRKVGRPNAGLGRADFCRHNWYAGTLVVILAVIVVNLSATE